MTEKMLLLRPKSDGENLPPWTVVDLDSDNFLDAVHNAIDCRCFDAVDVFLSGVPFVLLVDDDGLLKENPSPNVPAWFWYSQFNSNAPIVGKVLVCKEGLRDGEPDCVGLSDKDIEFLTLELLKLKQLLG